MGSGGGESQERNLVLGCRSGVRVEMCKSGGQAVSESGNWTGLLQEELRYSDIQSCPPHFQPRASLPGWEQNLRHPHPISAALRCHTPAPKRKLPSPGGEALALNVADLNLISSTT